MSEEIKNTDETNKIIDINSEQVQESTKEVPPEDVQSEEEEVMEVEPDEVISQKNEEPYEVYAKEFLTDEEIKNNPMVRGVASILNTPPQIYGIMLQFDAQDYQKKSKENRKAITILMGSLVCSAISVIEEMRKKQRIVPVKKKIILPGDVQ